MRPNQAPSVQVEIIDGQISEDNRDIFISHASKDREIVQLFVNGLLRLGMNISAERIFCTSLEGMNIRTGADFRREIQTALNKSKVTILIVTPNYKASEVCLNEMGAAWASMKPIFPLITEPIDYQSVGVLMQPLQVPKISDPTALSDLRDRLVEELGLNFKNTSMWDTAKATFLTELEKVLKLNKFSVPKSTQEVERIEEENKELKAQLADAGKKIMDLQTITDKLRTAKDAAEVAKIDEESDSRDEIEKFETLTKEIHYALRAFPSVVQGIILCDYFGSKYDPPAGYDSELQKAVRQKQIEHDGERYEVKSGNRDVKKVFSLLKSLEKLENENAELADQYEFENFDSDLDLSNEDFWREHFSVKIPY